MQKYYTSKEVAEILGINVKTLSRYRERNQSPPYFKKGNVIRYPISDLEAWLKAHTRT
jgi:excisionase family DNA binding protein